MQLPSHQILFNEGIFTSNSSQCMHTLDTGNVLPCWHIYFKFILMQVHSYQNHFNMFNAGNNHEHQCRLLSAGIVFDAVNSSGTFTILNRSCNCYNILSINGESLRTLSMYKHFGTQNKKAQVLDSCDQKSLEGNFRCLLSYMKYMLAHGVKFQIKSFVCYITWTDVGV